MQWSNIIGDALRALVGSEAVVFALAAIGLNVHFGYTGLLNFGQAAFLAVAAYGLATIVVTFGLPFWVGILVGFAGVIVLAVLLGVPTLRLRADYLAIVTIAAAEIIRLIFRSVSLRDTFGGSGGISGFSTDFYAINPYDGRVGLGPFEFGPRDAWVLTVGWILVIIACLIVWALMRSPWGRVIKAIREDEDAVRSLGKNVYSYKMQSLIIGGLLGALGGFIFALAQAAVQPDLYSTNLTFFAYTILILHSHRCRTNRCDPDLVDGHKRRGRGPVHAGRPRPPPAAGVPAAGDLRRPEGDRARCPMSLPSTRR
jgi:branched-chain amino acid transport system permease protein